LLDVVHPAARILVDISRSQDAEVGDGTTSVVVLAAEFLKESKGFVEEGVPTRIIIKGFRTAARLAENKIKEIAVKIDQENKRDTLLKLATTAMSSKLIKRNSVFFANMVVNAVAALDQNELNEKLIGMKKVPGGGLQDSLFVNGVAFKKTFSYAGFEQQPKVFKNPKIVCLNVELELKSEKDNAEVRVEHVSDYQAIVDAEWQIIFSKLQALVDTGAQVVLSKLPIGDLATQYVSEA
jgi:T-complex protein 1 subunit eta